MQTHLYLLNSSLLSYTLSPLLQPLKTHKSFEKIRQNLLL